MGTQAKLEGTRFELTADDAMFPEALRRIPIPPEKLYIIGSVDALSTEGVAIVGARKATPYGKECAAKFATMLAVRYRSGHWKCAGMRCGGTEKLR